ncbi:SDR family NAD(P)-dependent oxidoreductase [Streptococcus rifensis]
MNVGLEEDWKKLIGFVKDNYGYLDVLVNNAGIEMGKDIHAMSFEEFKMMQNCNVDGVFLGSKYAYEVLVKHGDASIINISSVSSKRSGPNCGNDAGYSASKAAVNLLTKHVAYTYAPDGIRVNVILPGGIRTPMVDESLKNVPNATDYLKSINPLPPHLGKVEDIADLVYFVASAENAYMNGAELVSDSEMITY